MEANITRFWLFNAVEYYIFECTVPLMSYCFMNNVLTLTNMNNDLYSTWFMFVTVTHLLITNTDTTLL